MIGYTVPNINDNSVLLRGCIQLGFQWILKDFFMMTKSCGIQLGFLKTLKKSSGIQLGF